MKKCIYFVLILSLLMLAVPANAAETSDGDFAEVEQAPQFLQCEYDTRDITSYVPSMQNEVIQSTWDLFPEQQVYEMSSTMTALSTGSGVSTRDIIGTSDFFDAHPISAPYSSIAYLRAYFDSNGDGATDYIMSTTGFLVSEKILITSAQGVVPRDTSTTTLIELRIYFGMDSSSLSGASYLHPRRWTWSTAWHDSSTSWKYDYCVIELWDEIERPFYFNCIESSNLATGQNIYISGYPSAYNYYQKACHGQITSSNYYNCNFNNDMLTGMHGAPLYNNYCVGIATYRATTYNMGNLFTEHIYELICSKISENS